MCVCDRILFPHDLNSNWGQLSATSVFVYFLSRRAMRVRHSANTNIHKVTGIWRRKFSSSVFIPKKLQAQSISAEVALFKTLRVTRTRQWAMTHTHPHYTITHIPLIFVFNIILPLTPPSPMISLPFRFSDYIFECISHHSFTSLISGVRVQNV